MTTFVAFPKIARLNREIVITEKLDGTNAQVEINDAGDDIVSAGSRNRYITPEMDNHGFARWVRDNRDELIKLGPGRHYGEWWGNGIQHGYGLGKGDKRFSLFNVGRWEDPATRPACCGVVPVLYRGPFSEAAIQDAVERLRTEGSMAAPGWMRPEGVIVYHTAAGTLFKVTLEKDAAPKSTYDAEHAARIAQAA
ncbi:RNA ligase [Caulobacter phage CcrSC]|uniref:RNA ligase domain-containing protein n=1 Tax=Caulobacter phage CcrSC TaxID=2283272 RepID=A0A385ED26_9CAUD|nr:RNA ligase [Caulobacter phage CcrSC]AXQ69771.1 hypothetical protein CcrSC_gp189 [Caulobacter phage CcrSC]